MKKLLLVLALLIPTKAFAADYYDLQHYRVTPDTTTNTNVIQFRGDFKLYDDTTTVNLNDITPKVVFYASGTVVVERIVATEAVFHSTTTIFNDAITFSSTTVFNSTSTFNDTMVLAATEKFYVDGGSDTYIFEHAANAIKFITNGLTAFQLNADQAAIIQPTKKFFLDGGVNTYITESAADIIQFYTENVLLFEINRSVGVRVQTELLPYIDDNSGVALGSTSYYWYGLWYGAGGLNQKASFQDLKSTVTIINVENKYDSLPVYGTYKRLEKGTTAPLETGFIIEDDLENKDDYIYIVTDSSGNVSMRLDLIVAQLCVALKDADKRIKGLKARIELLEK